MGSRDSVLFISAFLFPSPATVSHFLPLAVWLMENKRSHTWMERGKERKRAWQQALYAFRASPESNTLIDTSLSRHPSPPHCQERPIVYCFRGILCGPSPSVPFKHPELLRSHHPPCLRIHCPENNQHLSISPSMNFIQLCTAQRHCVTHSFLLLKEVQVLRRVGGRGQVKNLPRNLKCILGGSREGGGWWKWVGRCEFPWAKSPGEKY